MRRTEEQENKRRKKKIGHSFADRLKEKLKFNISLDTKTKKWLIVGASVIILIITINNYTSLGLVINKNIDIDDAVQINLQTSNNKIIPLGNEILVYNKGVITSYNNHGKNTVKITLEDSADVDITTSGEYIQVINKDKGVVYVYKDKYEVARIKIQGQIYSGIINNKGVSIIEYSANGGKTALGIYDSQGQIKYNVKLSNKMIGKYVISNNSKYLAYADVNISGISVQTNINVIDLSNIKENENNITTVHTVENSVAFDIYWDGNDVVIRTDEAYVIYNVSSRGKKEIGISDGQVVHIADYENRYVYTALDENGKYVLVIRKMLSNKAKMIELKDVPKYLAYKNGIIYVCYDKMIEVYNNSGIKLKSYNSNIIITEPIIFNDGRSLAMTVSNKVIMFTI